VIVAVTASDPASSVVSATTPMHWSAADSTRPPLTAPFGLGLNREPSSVATHAPAATSTQLIPISLKFGRRFAH